MLQSLLVSLVFVRLAGAVVVPDIVPVSPGRQENGELKVVVQSFPPGKKLGPGTVALIEVQNLGQDEAVWHYNKMEGDILLDFGTSKYRMFCSTTPGVRMFVVQVPRDGLDRLGICQFDYDNGAPTPTPTPDPKPEPSDDLWIFFVYQSEENDEKPWQANVVNSQEIRRLRSGNVHMKWCDYDERDEHGNVPEVSRSWIRYCEESNLPLPQIFFTDSNSKILGVQPLPKTVQETKELIESYIGKESNTSSCTTGKCYSWSR